MKLMMENSTQVIIIILFWDQSGKVSTKAIKKRASSDLLSQLCAMNTSTGIAT